MEAPKKKKKKRKKHEEAHEGSHGSWKVAYADFVTAMMAFFLLMWLLNMSSAKSKGGLAEYFKNFTLMGEKGVTFMDSTDSKGGAFLKVIPGDASSGEVNKPPNTKEEEKLSESERIIKDIIGKQKQIESKEELAEEVKKEVESKLGDMKDHVIVEIVDNGVRIQLVDNESNMMFPLGSSELTSKAKEVMKVLTDKIKTFNGKFIIEGHTDARPYPSRYFTNWELSSDRAAAARREIERNGIISERLVRVSGYAANEPLVKENPYDPKNRRISILCLNEEKPKQANQELSKELSKELPKEEAPKEKSESASNVKEPEKTSEAKPETTHKSSH